jgi:hypothetical protein
MSNVQQCVTTYRYVSSIFREMEEVASMMNSLSEVSSEERKREQLLERWKYLLDLYQEQPHLLDPHLPTILGTVHVICFFINY